MMTITSWNVSLFGNIISSAGFVSSPRISTAIRCTAAWEAGTSRRHGVMIGSPPQTSCTSQQWYTKWGSPMRPSLCREAWASQTAKKKSPSRPTMHGKFSRAGAEVGFAAGIAALFMPLSETQLQGIIRLVIRIINYWKLFSFCCLRIIIGNYFHIWYLNYLYNYLISISPLFPGSYFSIT